MTTTFGRLFGCTPHDWLTRKRVGIARRLIAQGESDTERIAQASGMGSRWALRRALARWPEAGALVRCGPTADDAHAARGG